MDLDVLTAALSCMSGFRTRGKNHVSAMDVCVHM